MLRRSNRPLVIGWLLLAILFIGSLPFVTPRIYASDEVEGFSWLHSLFFDRDVSFDNEYAYFYDSGQVKNSGFHETFLEDRVTDTGRRPNFTTMGAAILWAPFYGAGHLAAVMSGARADGLSQPYVTAVAVGSATYGFLALLLSMGIARRLVGGEMLATLAVWLGTPLLFYMYVTPIFTHACSAFAVALFLWTWLRVRERWTFGGALALGLTGGLMSIVRAQDALFAAGPILDFLRAFVLANSANTANGATRQPTIRTSNFLRATQAATAGALGFLLAYAPQLMAFHALNGHYRQSEFETRKMTWTSPHGWQVLIDRQHGLFFWTPLAALAFIGLIVLTFGMPARAQDDRALALAPSTADVRWLGFLAIVMFALQAYIAGSVESWTVAGAFGQRRFVSLTPLLVLGLASWIAAASRCSRPIRVASTCLLLLGVWWNLGLVAQFGMHAMDRQRLTLRSNAWNSFVELPRDAPSLAWRYLTDRASFYNRPRQ